MNGTNIVDLEIFIAVSETGGFSNAANALDIQIAKVSRSVHRLEQHLQVTLFNRTTRRVELTHEGKLFLGYAKQTLATLNQGQEEIKALRQKPSGKLRVDAVSPFLIHQVIPLIGAFSAEFPDIQLELISNESIIDLLEQRTDVAIRIGQLTDSNLHATMLGRSPLRMVATPKYLEENGMPQSIAELATHKIIGFAGTPSLNKWPLCQSVTLRPSIYASSGESVRQLVLNHQGIALLSNFMSYQDLENNRLIEVLPGEVASPNPRELVQAVYYKQTTLSPRIRAFIDFLKAHLSL
ncbi:LysR substrate-binding domain-containing protein [Thalassotalea euphylliae]|uniref:LysR substrate-binding domain-containing protein n=1 Tax=Thalassotalea euphylliae TaxID=1655234 RepID=UPI003642B0AE